MNVLLWTSLGMIAGVCLDELVRYFIARFEEEKWRR